MLETIHNQIESILENARSEQVQTSQRLVIFEKKFLGKNSLLNQLNKELKLLTIDQKIEYGKKLQLAKKEIEEIYHNHQQTINAQQESAPLYDFSSHITPVLGQLHPLTKLNRLIQAIFTNQGFEQAFGPDVELSHYNFDALNTPLSHPSRSLRDTFYLHNNKLLRTHTTCIQARLLEQKTPPIKSFMQGSVYRRDDDATHTPMFNQLEVLVVDQNLTFAHLKTFIISLITQLFEGVKDIKFRPSFFPFTYLSAEVDIKLDGKWLELLGCGMVHPKILENFSIDSNIYQGFALGLGIERLAMLKYNICDMRQLYENDIDFLDSQPGS